MRLSARPLGPALVLAAVTAIAAVTFGPVLKVGFLWDDHEMIERGAVVHLGGWQGVKAAFQGDVFEGKGDAYYRPLQTLLNMADHALWGLEPAGYHATNLLLHALCAWLVFLTLRRLTGRDYEPFFAAVCLVAHPVIVEQLLIVAGRAEIMAAVFALAAWHSFLRETRTGDAAGLVFYACAALSKESGLVLPLWLALGMALYGRPKVSRPAWGGIAVLTVLYLILRARAVGPAGAIVHRLGVASLDVIPAMAEYARIVLFPYDLHSHRRMVFGVTALAAAGLAAGGLAVWLWRRRRVDALLATGLFVTGLAPKIPLLATNALMLDHWAYVAAIGIYWALATGLARLAARSRAAALTAAGVAVFLMMSWVSLARFNIARRSTDRDLLAWALRFPSSSVVRYNLGYVEYREGRYAEAEALFRAALGMDPGNSLAANALALALGKMSRQAEAVAVLDGVLAREPGHALSLVNRAAVTGGESGLADLDAVIARTPGYAPAWRLKAVILSELGRATEAAAARRRFEELSPAR